MPDPAHRTGGESETTSARTIHFVGVDPGLRCLGWGVVAAVGGALTLVDAGTVRPDPTLTMERRLADLYAGLEAVVHRYHPQAASVEAVFHSRNAASAIKLGQARGAALLALAHGGVETFEYAPRAVKLSVVGHGDASKEQVAFMVGRILADATERSRDATDALAMAICHAHSVGSVAAGADVRANRTSWRRMTAEDARRLSKRSGA
ncbi:MAG: crossover junction endodeoxyribonuclease RuvC [Myxococcales bacterium]|nr:crossover junction endodeoxyribonuclease RuvC [Myxococcales bacterium]